MTAPDIHETDLEDLLVYDDLFLDYFNTFLALPAFPVRTSYDRLTGNVRDLEGTLQDDFQDFGASDLQVEAALFWLRQERFPLFRRSPLYLEYKLVKLLLRPLECPQPASRYGIRGYSRQTTSAALSTSHGSPLQLSAPSVWPEEARGMGGGSPCRVHSTPAAPGYDSDPYRLSLLEQYGDAIMRLCQTPDPETAEQDPETMGQDPGTAQPNPKTEQDTCVALTHNETKDPSCPESPHVLLHTEAPVLAEGHRDPRDPRSEDPGMDPEDLYSFTAEEENFVKQHNLTMTSLQQLKEEALSSREGMGHFLHFLQDTQGSHIFRFWMDCEAFREQSVDLEAQHSPEDARHLCVHLFRNIQNKYQLYLSPQCQEQIRLCQQIRGPSYHALRRPQYDSLRRLRSYWIPRFLIHCQRRPVVRHRAQQGEALDSSPLVGAAGDDASTPPGLRDCDRVWGPRDHLEGPGPPLPDRMAPALGSDAQAGGVFLHHLNRFEPPKTSQIFLLWQELNEYGEWREEQNQNRARQPRTHKNSIKMYPEISTTQKGDSSGHKEAAPGGRSDLSSGGIHLEDLGSAYHLALAALRDPWIRFLKYDITMFLKFCVSPSHKKSQDSGSTASRGTQARKKRSNKENRAGAHQFGGGKKVKRRQDPLMVPGLITGHPDHHPQDPDIPLEMLQHRAVYKAYKKLVQETEEPQSWRLLEMLHALQASKEEERKLLAVVQKVLELEEIQIPQLQGLRKHLMREVSKGAISTSSITQVSRFLSMLLATSFNKFWGEMSEQLKDYGVEQSGEERWARLEPLLLVLSTKMATKRLHGRRSNVYHPAQLEPSADDGATFDQALEMAAQGWPTPEVLHFLKYLQTHGPPEGLPLLENNLLCCLELRKYRNVHHARPDHGLIKRKVHIIKERFLSSQDNPVLQVQRGDRRVLEAEIAGAMCRTHTLRSCLDTRGRCGPPWLIYSVSTRLTRYLSSPETCAELSPDLVESALRDTEVAAHGDPPSIALYDPLHDWLMDSLLPFWAGFWKTWASRSPASAQRVPLLRVQQMLRRRLALFEVEETPLRTFHLPPVQPNPKPAAAATVTYSFSMTHGLTLKESDAQTPDPPSRRTSQTRPLPPIHPASPERTRRQHSAASHE